MAVDAKRFDQVKAGEPVREPMLDYFQYGHLRADLVPVAERFSTFVMELVDRLPNNAERTHMLRKLLEAKDCAVRCQLDERRGA